ncbi:AGAP006143-PD [Anopheles gambiae str. PEST]|uniref:Gustatory receptor n=1 Tax=Anopheles gambiae TaxID=7165 RepID=A7UU25_ANOGA|nr:AGAP006143-PD [Anopheles gambiae str. PEST]
MEELKILNLFNHFLVSPVQLHRTEQQKSNSYIFRNRNLLWNTAVLSSLTLVSATSALLLVLHDFAQLLTTVMGVITMILYGIRLVVVVPLICWTLLNGRTLVDISNRALAIERQFGSDRVVLINVWLLTQTQICIALVMLLFNIVLQLYYILSFEGYQKAVNIVVVFGFFVLETFISLHRGYVQFWPAFLSHRYAKLISRAAYKHNHSLQTVMALGSDLESFKRKCSSIFGLMQLLHLLNIFVTCSVEAYIVFHVVDMGLGIHYVPMNLVAALTYGASFLIYTYAHNLVNVKEAELKDALKSMQYTNLKRQSRDQKDFYDLVNLKLMMESPKITACGLFEINLQIFYNVFAAIITYIVILFQFRGFEKSP